VAISDYASLTAAIGAWTHRSTLISGSPPLSDYLIQSAQEQFDKDLFDMNFGNGIRYQEASYAPSLITGGTAPLPTDWLAPKVFTLSDGTGYTNTLIFKAAAWIYDNYPARVPSGPPAYIARDRIEAAAFTAAFGPDGTLTVSALASGLIQVGMTIADTTSMLPPTTPGNAVIVTGGSGVGGAGIYTAQSCSPLAPTYTISSESMTGGGDVFVFGPYPDSDYQIQGTYYASAPLLSYGGATTNWMVQYAPMTLLAYCMVAAAQFLKDAEMLQTWQPQAQVGCKGLVDKDKAERWAASTMAVDVG
jgi:hypothetical protein